jgi:hypothetical protein
MNHERNIRIGAIAWGVLAVFAAVIPAFHGLPDLVLINVSRQAGSAVNLPEGFAFPYLLAGVIYEPVLVICIVLFGICFVSIWKTTKEKSAFINLIGIFIYAGTRAFWAWVDINYARAIGALERSGSWEEFASAEMFKGLGAGINGLVGIGLAVCLTIFFIRSDKDGRRWNVGTVGAIIVAVSVFLSVVTKTLTLWYFPFVLTAMFSVFLTLKSIGLGMMAIAIYQRASR